MKLLFVTLLLATAILVAPKPRRPRSDLGLDRVQTTASVKLAKEPVQDNNWFEEQTELPDKLAFCWICSCWTVEEPGNINGRTEHMKMAVASL